MVGKSYMCSNFLELHMPIFTMGMPSNPAWWTQYSLLPSLPWEPNSHTPTGAATNEFLASTASPPWYIIQARPSGVESSLGSTLWMLGENVIFQLEWQWNLPLKWQEASCGMKPNRQVKQRQQERQSVATIIWARPSLNQANLKHNYLNHSCSFFLQLL